MHYHIIISVTSDTEPKPKSWLNFCGMLLRKQIW